MNIVGSEHLSSPESFRDVFLTELKAKFLTHFPPGRGATTRSFENKIISLNKYFIFLNDKQMLIGGCQDFFV